MARSVAAGALVLAPLALLLACGAPVAPPRAAAVRVTSEPAASLDAIPSVLRLHVEGFGSVASSLALIEGEIGPTQAARIRQGELPSTLVPRAVPSFSFGESEGEGAVLVPSAPLGAGAAYTLVGVGAGPLAALVVSPEPATLAMRLWPPRNAPGGSRSVFCAPTPLRVGTGRAQFAPAALEVTYAEGADSAGAEAERCLHFDLEGATQEGVVVPPPGLGAVEIDPLPLLLAPSEAEGLTAICARDEAALGPGCVGVEDDRALIRSAPEPLLWSLRVGEERLLEPLAGGERRLVTGLVPGASVLFEGTVTRLGGKETPFSALFTTSPAREHVVLNEVLANPTGPEPAQEWVELTNDGAVPVDVGGFALSDSGGDTVLPTGVLAPGGFALVVGRDFDATASADVPPQAGTLLLRVPRVGVSGLSNSGEVLTLKAKDGAVLSRFPATAAPKAGKSAARRIASGLDDDPTAFTSIAEPSPGWDNYIATP